MPPARTTQHGGGQRLADPYTIVHNEEAVLPLSESGLVESVPWCLGVVCSRCQSAAELSDQVGGACACGAPFARVVPMDYLQAAGTQALGSTSTIKALRPEFESQPNDIREGQLWQSTAFELLRRYWLTTS